MDPYRKQVSWDVELVKEGGYVDQGVVPEMCSGRSI
jgi:hypothetical protein